MVLACTCTSRLQNSSLTTRVWAGLCNEVTRTESPFPQLSSPIVWMSSTRQVWLDLFQHLLKIKCFLWRKKKPAVPKLVFWDLNETILWFYGVRMLRQKHGIYEWAGHKHLLHIVYVCGCSCLNLDLVTWLHKHIWPRTIPAVLRGLITCLY